MSLALRCAAEQAREALNRILDCEQSCQCIDRRALDALDAALAEPVHPGYVIGSHWLETAYSRIAAGEAEDAVLAEMLGERGWVKREPATDVQVTELCKAKGIPGKWSRLDYHTGWRDAERFHKITKEDGK